MGNTCGSVTSTCLNVEAQIVLFHEAPDCFGTHQMKHAHSF